MQITATELKSNIGKYLALAAKEEIIITKSGRRIARLSGVTQDKTDIVTALTGILPGNADRDEARKERLAKNESVD